MTDIHNQDFKIHLKESMQPSQRHDENKDENQASPYTKMMSNKLIESMLDDSQ